MTQLAKFGIAGVSLTVIGAGTAYAVGLFNKQNTAINNTSYRLSSEGFEVLDPKQNDAEWTKVLEGYVKAKKGTFKKGGGADANKKKEELIDECKKQLKLNTDESYELARRWCVKEQSVSDILNKGYTQLDNAQEKPKEKAIWDQKVSALKSNTENKFQKLREKLKNPSTDVATLRTECKNLKPNEIKTTSDTFGDVFEQTRKFCSNKK